MKLEKDVAASSLNRPSKIYALLSKAPGEQIFYLILRSQQRTVQDRIRNYLQKYIPTAQEITDQQVVEAGFTSRYAEIREGESRNDRKAAGRASEKTRARSRNRELAVSPAQTADSEQNHAEPDELVAGERLAEEDPGPQKSPDVAE